MNKKLNCALCGQEVPPKPPRKLWEVRVMMDEKRFHCMSRTFNQQAATTHFHTEVKKNPKSTIKLLCDGEVFRHHEVGVSFGIENPRMEINDTNNAGNIN